MIIPKKEEVKHTIGQKRLVDMAGDKRGFFVQQFKVNR